MQTHTTARRLSRTTPVFSPPEVLSICRRFVYPPCKKLSGGIGLQDRLTADLGYFGTNNGLLALKTNQSFELGDAGRISSLDISLMTTVEDHVLGICKRLHNEHRLADDADACFGIT